MTYYTVFDRNGNIDEVNVVFLCNRKSDAIHTCQYINGEMIRGKFADEHDYGIRYKQEGIRHKVIHFIEWAGLYLDGMEWKRKQSDDEFDDDDLEEGVRKMSFNDLVKSIRKRASNRGYKRLYFTEDYENISHEEIVEKLKREMDVEYIRNPREFIESLADDMWTVEGNRYYLLPSIYDDYHQYQIRMYDGRLITNVEEKTPIILSEIMRGVIDVGHPMIYRDAEIQIDEEYFNQTGELMYYFYV